MVLCETLIPGGNGLAVIMSVIVIIFALIALVGKKR